jgi:Na+/H+ antiporter NhaD/arsenite permease-like protein
MPEAFRAVDWDTVALLLGMLTLSGFLAIAGFFDWAAVWIARTAGTASRLLLAIVLSAGMLSALLVNDTVCLMLTPVVVVTIARTDLPLLPFLLALATGANIGSVMTVVGNPQNMLVGNFSGLSYASFAASLAPVGAVCLLLDYFLLRALFRRELAGRPILPAAAPAQPVRVDRPLLAKALLAHVLVLAGFLAGLPVSWTALAGASLLIALASRHERQALAHVDWPLLLFFAALFIVIAGFERTALPDRAFAALGPLFSGGRARQAFHLTWFSALGSNVVSNVPFVLVAKSCIPQLADPRLMWKVLAMAMTFAGNLTILGSAANIIVVEMARPYVEVGFWDYARYGIPITLLTLAVGLAMLLAWTG